jgi:hypothetical protein
MFRRVRQATEATSLNASGLSLSDAGDIDGAIAAYRAATAADPRWSVPWYNLGLQYKYRREWRLSADCNREALQRDESDEAAWWNLGIAATALSDWNQARIAWKRCGIAVPEGTGPIELNLGLTPMRLPSLEVVWCQRIDPARGVIRSVPLPESGHFFGDILLHDGAPNGTRVRNGIEVPVFDVLTRLNVSEFRTYILDIPGATASQRATLCDLAHESGMAAEDWAESVSFICRSCSEGRPHDAHDGQLRQSRPGLPFAVAAATDQQLELLVEKWRHSAGYDGYAGVVPARCDI